MEMATSLPEPCGEGFALRFLIRHGRLNIRSRIPIRKNRFPGPNRSPSSMRLAQRSRAPSAQNRRRFSSSCACRHPIRRGDFIRPWSADGQSPTCLRAFGESHVRPDERPPSRHDRLRWSHVAVRSWSFIYDHQRYGERSRTVSENRDGRLRQYPGATPRISACPHALVGTIIYPRYSRVGGLCRHWNHRARHRCSSLSRTEDSR